MAKRAAVFYNSFTTNQPLLARLANNGKQLHSSSRCSAPRPSAGGNRRALRGTGLQRFLPDSEYMRVQLTIAAVFALTPLLILPAIFSTTTSRPRLPLY